MNCSFFARMAIKHYTFLTATINAVPKKCLRLIETKIVCYVDEQKKV